MLPSKYEDNTLHIKEKSTEKTALYIELNATARSATAKVLDHYARFDELLFYLKFRLNIERCG